MSAITRVALAGGSGNLGSTVLDQLLKAGLNVTVLTRQGSSHSFPRTVSVISVQYDSLSSLTNALRDQDAVVSTVGTAAVETQLLLVEAAAKAGVKRFIPSEFGSDTLHEKTAQLPVFEGKISVQKALKEKAAEGTLSYTLIFTGPILDYLIKLGMLVDLKHKSAVLFDGGMRPFSATTGASIGTAVVGVLRYPGETKNRAVRVRSCITTPKQLAFMGKTAVGLDGWTEDHVSVDGLLSEAWAELKKAKPNPGIFAVNFIKASVWGEGYGLPFLDVDNELLGVREMNDGQLQGMITELAQ